MPRAAEYLIAQHIPNVFRREARNVGVIVTIDQERTSRFFGETVGGHISGTKTRGMNCPGVYKQWVDYWQRTLKEAESPFDELLRTSGQHYQIVPGGEVGDIGDDSVHDVAMFLYSSLVSEDGMAAALGGETEEVAIVRLRVDITKALTSADIFADEDGAKNENVKHPVRTDVIVNGQKAKHRPAFVQENGRLVVMETVDFTSRQKERAKDHAGWAAFMFTDMESAERISIVRAEPQDEKDENVRYALDMLSGTSQIVNWSSSSEQKRFIDERVAVAMG